MNNKNKTDVLGIISITCAAIGITPLGLILGIVGVITAKKEARSTTVSKVGWILNLVLMLFSILWVVSVLLTGKYKAGA